MFKFSFLNDQIITFFNELIIQKFVQPQHCIRDNNLCAVLWVLGQLHLIFPPDLEGRE